MFKNLICILIVFSIVACSSEGSNEIDSVSDEIELNPTIEMTINPENDTIPYNSDLTINWVIKNAKTAYLDNEPINLIGSKQYTNITENTSFKILATNISKEETITKSITVGQKPTPPLFFDVIFANSKKYFSTDGSMTNPVSRNTAMNSGIANKIDITYTYEAVDDDPGFMDPVTRSQSIFGWRTYHQPWLDVAVETVFYIAAITIEEYNEAKLDESKIGEFFLDDKMEISTGGSNFPNGSSIGESISTWQLLKTRRFGFKNLSTGKRGIIFIHATQNQYWPDFIENNETKVQILREH